VELRYRFEETEGGHFSLPTRTSYGSESVSAEDIFAVSSGESIEFNGNLSLMEIVAK
jgi:hypothetical protein